MNTTLIPEIYDLLVKRLDIVKSEIEDLFKKTDAYAKERDDLNDKGKSTEDLNHKMVKLSDMYAEYLVEKKYLLMMIERYK